MADARLFGDDEPDLDTRINKCFVDILRSTPKNANTNLYAEMFHTIPEPDFEYDPEAIAEQLELARDALRADKLLVAQLQLGPSLVEHRQKFNQFIVKKRTAWCIAQYQLSLVCEAHYASAWYMTQLYYDGLFARCNKRITEDDEYSLQEKEDFRNQYTAAYTLYTQHKKNSLNDFAIAMTTSANESMNPYTFSLNAYLTFLKKIEYDVIKKYPRTASNYFACARELNLQTKNRYLRLLHEHLQKTSEKTIADLRQLLTDALTKQIPKNHADETFLQQCQENADEIILKVVAASKPLLLGIDQLIARDDLAIAFFNLDQFKNSLIDNVAQQQKNMYRHFKSEYANNCVSSIAEFEKLAKSIRYKNDIDIDKTLASNIGELNLGRLDNNEDSLMLLACTKLAEAKNNPNPAVRDNLSKFIRILAKHKYLLPKNFDVDSMTPKFAWKVIAITEKNLALASEGMENNRVVLHGDSQYRSSFFGRFITSQATMLKLQQAHINNIHSLAKAEIHQNERQLQRELFPSKANTHHETELTTFNNKIISISDSSSSSRPTR